MQAFTDFVLTIALPPNPVRALDNQLTDAQAHGRDLFFDRRRPTRRQLRRLPRRSTRRRASSAPAG